jgi:hypothetical protein
MPTTVSTETPQQRNRDQEAHQDADPTRENRVDHKGHQPTGDRAQDATPGCPQGVVVLVVDHEGDGEQGVPEIGDALKMLCDGAGDQHA